MTKSWILPRTCQSRDKTASGPVRPSGSLGVFASLNNLVVRHLLCRNIGSERDVEPDRACIQRRLLADERHVRAVRVDVQFGYVATVDFDLARERITKSHA